MLAPACNKPTSRVNKLTSRNEGGTSPATIFWAKPSTTAVLPTPASPVNIGLFWRRRIKMSITCLISSSRPTMGSILPERACSVKSTVNCFKACCLPICAGAIAPLASPGTAPPPTLKPSLAVKPCSGEPLRISSKRSVSVSALIFSNSLEILVKAWLKPLVFNMPTIRCPERTCDSPNINVPKTQPRSTASSMC